MLWLFLVLFAVFVIGTWVWAMLKASASEAPEWDDATTVYEWKKKK